MIPEEIRWFIAEMNKWWDRDADTHRTVCTSCQFETTDGKTPSHAPGCDQE